MKNRKPIICLTLRGKPFDAGRREPTTAPFEWITNAYVRLVAQSGGVPMLLSNECPVDDVERVVGFADGLLLTGGEDMAPEHFGEAERVDNLTINSARDRVELEAIAVADKIDMPIFGICRGIQVLNIARGGTVYQDLTKDCRSTLRDHSRGASRVEVQTHTIAVKKESRLAQIVGSDNFEAASDHHQAVNTLGGNLVVVAHSPEDDIIEAVEEPGSRFVVGVQWHPEVRPDDAATRNLFEGFLSAARQFAADESRVTVS